MINCEMWIHTHTHTHTHTDTHTDSTTGKTCSDSASADQPGHTHTLDDTHTHRLFNLLYVSESRYTYNCLIIIFTIFLIYTYKIMLHVKIFDIYMKIFYIYSKILDIYNFCVLLRSNLKIFF
eukprot:GHVR01033804.1.p1 GENE.GHVR01033804.1~~GHVR01033804.1.p1  ORF type:complete len:122 (-),score=47.99 GHVR01033804.1:53-418(-)